MKTGRQLLSILLVGVMLLAMPISAVAEATQEDLGISVDYGHCEPSPQAGCDNPLIEEDGACDLLRSLKTKALTKGNTTDFAGGSGTEADPYIIKTKAHLNNVRNYLSACFCMEADIVFTEADFVKGGNFYNNGTGWQPIGTYASAFTGIFDGNGHTVTGLRINVVSDSTVYVGLFGYVKNGEIKNIGMVDSEIFAEAITRSINAGGVAGRIYKGTITGCYNTGSISAVISKATSTSYSAHVGGIVGYLDTYSTAVQCYNVGNVTATGVYSDSSGNFQLTYPGGITGTTYYADIVNCYNTGTISGSGSVGGIVCTAYATNVTNCYNTGTVSGSQSSSGGIAQANPGSNIKNCFYLNNTSKGVGNALSNGTDATVSCTTAELQAQSTFKDYDFDTVWTMEGDATYPYPELQGLKHIVELQSIKVSREPDTLSYVVNYGTLDTAGGKLVLYYHGNFSKTIDLEETAVTGFDNTIVGTQTLTVTYLDKKTTFDIEIIPRALSSIAVTAKPAKLTYLESKDTLDVSGGQITLTYNDDSTEIMDITPDMVAGFNNSKVGFQSLVVTYGEKTAIYEIEVIAKSLADIAITAKPEKMVFIEETALSTSGGQITLTYDNDTTEVVDITPAMVTGYNNRAIGKQTLMVTYNGKTSSYEVEIIPKSIVSVAVTTTPEKLTYLEAKEALSVTGGQITLTYDNDTTEVVNITPAMVSGFDNTEIGKQTLTVTYEGKTATYEVEILAKSLVSIAVTKLPEKLTYLKAKDALSVTGGQITLTYDNDTTEVLNITPTMVTGFDNSAIGKQILTVTYRGKTTTYEIEIQKGYIFGDLDGDGEVTDLDGILLDRYLVGRKVDIEYVDAMDCDSDGEITDWDSILLSRYLAGWNVNSQIGK